MAFSFIKPVIMEAQKNLNCGRYCLEAVMRWKYGTPYGVQGVNNLPRTAHPPAAQAHIDKTISFGFDPGDYMAEYRLKRISKIPTTAAEWEQKLQKYQAPIIVGGHIGTVSYIPIRQFGHFVVVTGVNASNMIVYMDPLNFTGKTGFENTISAQDLLTAIYTGSVYALL